jgi:hypothetical protein
MMPYGDPLLFFALNFMGIGNSQRLPAVTFSSTALLLRLVHSQLIYPKKGKSVFREVKVAHHILKSRDGMKIFKKKFLDTNLLNSTRYRPYMGGPWWSRWRGLMKVFS